MATSQRPNAPQPRRKPFPVTVQQLPLVRCTLCNRTLAHQPGETSAVLTAHYQSEHPEALGL